MSRPSRVRAGAESVAPPGAALLLPAMITLAWTACSDSAPISDDGGAGAAGAAASASASSMSSGGAACPADPPVHGAGCDIDMAEGHWCSYDRCDDDYTLVRARCDGQSWEVNYTFCDQPGCVGYGEDAIECPPTSVCVGSNVEPLCTPHPIWDCPANPCEHEPLSCACAGYLCGPFLECTGTHNGWVYCDPPPLRPNAPVLLTKSSGSDLMIHDGYAYWDAAEVRRVPITGGPYETFATVSGHLAMDPNYIYVGDTQSASLRRISFTTQAEDVLATSLPYLGDLAVNSQVALWASSTETLTIPITGGTATFLSAYTGMGIALDDSAAFVSIDFGLYSVPVVGASPTLLASENAQRIAVDATHVYFTHWDPQHQAKVFKVPKTGGALVLLASNQFEAGAIVVDDTHVYFERNDAYIMRVPKQGGTVEVFVEGDAAWSLAVDSTYLYWISKRDVYGAVCEGVWKKAK